MGVNRYAIRGADRRAVSGTVVRQLRKRRSKTFATKTEANKFLDNIKSDRNRGVYIDPNEARRTFRDVAELWFGSRNLRLKTARAYRAILDQRPYPMFVDRPIGSIATLDIAAWITDLSLHGK